MYKSEAATDLVKEIKRYKMKYVPLQEVRWDNFGSTKISKTTIFSGKCKQNHQLGTRFAVHESIIDTEREFKDINPILSTITLRTDNMYVSLINVHAPTEEKKIFYLILEDVFIYVMGNTTLVLGNLNAKVRRKSNCRNWNIIIGKHSLHEESNDNGTKLVNFAAGKGLVVKSTMFPQKDIIYI